jgi:hypothetical protein
MERHMSTRLRFLAAAFLLVAATACGGPPEAAGVYFHAGKAMAALTSYRMTEEVEFKGGGEPFRLEMDLVPPDKARLAVSYAEAGESFDWWLAIERSGIPSASDDYFIVPAEKKISRALLIHQALSAESNSAV